MADDQSTGRSWRDALDLGATSRVLAALRETDVAEDEAHRAIVDSPDAIAGYAVLRRLGGGSGGDVFLSVREGSDQAVALKLLNQRVGESPEARRAWREVDVLAQLRLPHLPRLLDHGLHDDRMYLVTEYVDGLPLLEHMSSTSASREDRVEMLARVADATHTLHERGVIHRDIKPSNILVDRAGEPVLIDLGIATLLSRDPEETLTKDGAPIGSPAFMSPEQARGERNAISTRSDVYGLGATGYVLLTGHTPHDMDATLHEAIRRVAQDQPRLPRELEPALPRPLAAVLARSVARDPGHRYASAAELARDLRRWLRREPVEAAGVTVVRRVQRFIGRHPIGVTIAVCACLLATTVAVNWLAIWWLNFRPDHMAVDERHRSVQLLSRLGSPLHQWDIGPKGTPWAQLLDRPAAYGGGRVGVVAFPKSAPGDRAGQLCVVDADEPGSFLWSSGNTEPDFEMPSPISIVREDAFFNVMWGEVCDVFVERPGPEIVAVHTHEPHSANVLRVYGFDGDDGLTVLYEVWHDGTIYDGHWLPRHRLLVFVCRSSEAPWGRRDERLDSITTPPIAIIAVRPEVGRIHDGWIRIPGGAGEVEAEWIRCLLPPEAVFRLEQSRSIKVRLDRPGRSSLAANHVDLALHETAPDASSISMHFYISARGDENVAERVVSERYAHVPELPPAASFSIGPLPPIIGPRPDDPAAGPDD